MRPFICIGDRTDHGGTVIEADLTFEIYGKPVALSGHKVVCRKCRGTFPIEKAAEDMTSMGQQVARHGDKTACGAVLIASQVLATWSSTSDGVPASASNTFATAGSAGDTESFKGPVAPQTPTLCLECLAAAAAKGSSLVARE